MRHSDHQCTPLCPPKSSCQLRADGRVLYIPRLTYIESYIECSSMKIAPQTLREAAERQYSRQNHGSAIPALLGDMATNMAARLAEDDEGNRTGEMLRATRDSMQLLVEISDTPLAPQTAIAKGNVELRCLKAIHDAVLELVAASN